MKINLFGEIFFLTLTKEIFDRQRLIGTDLIVRISMLLSQNEIVHVANCTVELLHIKRIRYASSLKARRARSGPVSGDAR